MKERRPLKNESLYMQLGSITSEPLVVEGRQINKNQNSGLTNEDMRRARIYRACQTLGVSRSVYNEAFSLWQKTAPSHQKSKRLLAMCVFIACRLHGVEKSPKEITESVGLKTKRPRLIVFRAMDLAKELGLDVARPDYRAILLRLVDEKGLPRILYHDAVALWPSVRSILNGNPKTSLGVAVYYLAKGALTQLEVGHAFGLSEFAIRGGYQQYISDGLGGVRR